MKTVSVKKLDEMLRSPEGSWPVRNWALFDVREVGESQKGHIASSTFLPRRMIEYRLSELVSAPATSLILYDGGGNDTRAQLAAKTMAAHEYTDITCLEGGYAAWKQAGLEEVTGWNVPSKDFGEQVLVTSKVPYLNSDELVKRQEAGENIGIFDVRTPVEYREASLPASTGAPSFEWALHTKDINDKYDAVVIHCAGRTRSIIGAATASLLGMKNLYSLENGTMGWVLSDHELESNSTGLLGDPSAASLADSAERAQELAESLGVKYKSPDELKTSLDNRAQNSLYVFDVRDDKGFQKNHIPSSILLPGGQACQRTDDFTAVPGSTVVFVDDDDARALVTAYWFLRMGFKDVSVLKGGVQAWIDAGHNVKSGRDRPAPIGIEDVLASTKVLDVADLQKALGSDEPPVLIDVGPSARVAACHIEGAKWIARGFLEEQIGDFAKTSDSVVFSAWEPQQAAFAAATLAQAGYQDVAWLNVPGKLWKDGLPTAAGVPADSAEVADKLAIPYRENKEKMLEYLEWEEELGKKYEHAATQADS